MAAAQMYYSMLCRDLDTDYKDFLETNGLGLMAWSPLASGFLSGKYTEKNPVPEDSRRAKFDFPPVDVDKGYRVVKLLQTIADKHSISVAQVALAWVVQRSFVSSVIIGATKEEQLQENLEAAEAHLDSEDITLINELTAVAAPYPAWMQPMGVDAQTEDALES